MVLPGDLKTLPLPDLLSLGRLEFDSSLTSLALSSKPGFELNLKKNNNKLKIFFEIEGSTDMSRLFWSCLGKISLKHNYFLLFQFIRNDAIP